MAVVDSHVHVFARGLRLAPARRYAPDYDATLDDYRAQMAIHSISHAVLVQPSFLGTDNSFLRETLRRDRARLRGIAVVDPGIGEVDLAALADDGVVGIRLNLDSLPIPDFAADPWPRFLESVRARGWHVEVHREARDLPRLVAPLVDRGLDVVIDHFGRPDDDLGANDPGFRYVLDVGGTRRVWVKLSGAYRNGSEGRGHAAAPRLASCLLERFGRERLVWGSDWPHTRHETREDLAAACRGLQSWVPDAADRAYIAGPSALTLYGF
ncbi:MAG TPA: amidohydrolase family protein [Casimicrobiaceae bacterium]|nr:amidohydrolase family protein [Casimicrobiaceae bacterium]